MPKINVYLPDDLAAAVKAAGLPVSPICQKALSDAVRVVNAARKGIAALRDPSFDPDKHPQLAARMDGRMTPRLREALVLARRAADIDGHLTSAHLLIGILDEGDNLAVRLLRSLDVDTDELREAARTAPADGTGPLGPADAEEAARAAAAEAVGAATGGSTEPSLWAGMSLAARIAIGGALEASIDLGHNYLGCEHLLIGLLDEDAGAARGVLRAAGVETAAIRRAIAAAAVGASQVHPGGTTTLDEVVRRLSAIEDRLSGAGL